MERQFERQTEKNRQKEENEYKLGINKEGLKENLTSRISPRKISFLWFHKRLKKCRGKNVNKHKFFVLFFLHP